MRRCHHERSRDGELGGSSRECRPRSRGDVHVGPPRQLLREGNDGLRPKSEATLSGTVEEVITMDCGCLGRNGTHVWM